MPKRLVFQTVTEELNITLKCWHQRIPSWRGLGTSSIPPCSLQGSPGLLSTEDPDCDSHQLQSPQRKGVTVKAMGRWSSSNKSARTIMSNSKFATTLSVGRSREKEKSYSKDTRSLAVHTTFLKEETWTWGSGRGCALLPYTRPRPRQGRLTLPACSVLTRPWTGPRKGRPQGLWAPRSPKRQAESGAWGTAMPREDLTGKQMSVAEAAGRSVAHKFLQRGGGKGVGWGGGKGLGWGSRPALHSTEGLKGRQGLRRQRWQSHRPFLTSAARGDGRQSILFSLLLVRLCPLWLGVCEAAICWASELWNNISLATSALWVLHCQLNQVKSFAEQAAWL